MSIPAPLVGKSTILPVASLVFRAFVGFVRADERMPRMSSVVKSEGDYEFQMAKEEAKSQTNNSTATARWAAGWSARQQAARAGGVT